jgi:hypothetical protein
MGGGPEEDEAMFEKWESKSYPHADATDLHRHAFQWWISTGFRVTETGPGEFRAVSASRWGLEREANIHIKDVNGTAIVEMRVKANVSTEGVLGGGLALVLLWPVAVVGGAYSYTQYEKDALDLMSAFWNTVGAMAQTAPTDHKEEVIHTTAIPNEEVPSTMAAPGGPGAMATPALTMDEKLDLLEDRLLKGEITEDTYQEIKSRMKDK